MKTTLRLLLALIPCLAQADTWRGYVYQDDQIVGYASLEERPDRAFGAFMIYQGPIWDFIAIDRTTKNLYAGKWFYYGSLNVWTPISAGWVEWGGYQYWWFATADATYYATLLNRT